MHGLHKDKIDDFWDVHARVEHIDRDREAWLVVLLEFVDQAVAVGTIVYPLDAVIDETLPLERAPEALSRLEERQVFGKLVITP